MSHTPPTSPSAIDVRKISHQTWVNVVDGVPQCPCHQEPMVERDGGWMCAVGSAALDLLADAVARLDKLTTTHTTEETR